MSKIYILPDGMRKELNTMTQIQRECASIEQTVRAVAYGLHIQGIAGVKLKNAILVEKDKIGEDRKDIGRLQHIGEEIVQKYVSTEHAIVNPEIKKKENKHNPVNPPKVNWGKEVASGLWKATGQFGIIGTVVSGIGLYHSSDQKTSDKIKAAKSVTDGVHKVLSGLDSKDSLWTILTGFGKKDTVNSANIATRWKKVVNKALGDHGIGSEAKNVGKVTTAVQWASTLLSVAGTVAGNYEEYKDKGGFHNKRMWAESVTETAVDVAVNWGAKALAGAAAAALIGPGAPVIVAGLFTVGIKWGADAITKKFTGKSFTEWASDSIIDGVGKAAKNAGKAISKWKSRFGW